MNESEHPLDKIARELTHANERVVESQAPSGDYWEFRFPLCDSEISESGVQASFNFDDPTRSVATLEPGCQWTDALSSDDDHERYLFNDAVLELLQRFEPGEYDSKEVSVTAADGETRKYNYVKFDNQLDPATIDFASSEFYFTDIIGVPLGPAKIESYDHWDKTFEKAQAGLINDYEEYTTIEHKKIVFRADAIPAVDFFTFQRLTIDVYVTNRLKEAVAQSGLTGFELRPTRRLFNPFQTQPKARS